MKTFRVRNFEKFQHYKNRNPPWIKLYTNTLENYEFGSLPDASKAHLTAIWLLASRAEGELPYDSDWISKRINATEKVDLQLLADVGFIVLDQGEEQSASKPLDQRQRQRQRQKEDTPSPSGNGSDPDSSLTDVPASLNHTQDAEVMFNTWNTFVPQQATKLTVARRQKLASRFKDQFHGKQSEWQAYCERIVASPFLLGENDRGWKAGLDWALEPRNVIKVMEGQYEGGTPNSENNPISPEDALQDTARIVRRILHDGAIRPDHWPIDYPLPEKMAQMLQHGLLTQEEADAWTQQGRGDGGE